MPDGSKDTTHAMEMRFAENLRVYYVISGNTMQLLRIGTKNTQKADIAKIVSKPLVIKADSKK